MRRLCGHDLYYTLVKSSFQMSDKCKDVKSGELPHFVSFVHHVDLRSRVFPRFFFFAASPASSPKFQRDGVIRELSAVDMNVEEKREGKRKNT